MTDMKPVVVDIYRGDKVEDFGAMKAAGIFGVIHKASQGKNYQDDTYFERRKAAEAAGLRWGAYHFCDCADPAVQVSNFVTACGPLDGVLIAVDFEDHPSGVSRNMTVAQLRQFLTLLMTRTGRDPHGVWLYGGSRLKAEITSPDDVAFFGQFRLWLCQYGPKAILPEAWKDTGYGLWQCSADGHGPEPHTIAGSSTVGIDLSVFGGNDIAAEWADERAEAPVTAPVVPPHPAKIAIKSPTIWSAAALVAVLHHAVQRVTDFASTIFNNVPQIASDTQTLIAPANDLLGIIHERSHEMEFALGLAALAIVVIRTIQLHQRVSN